MAIEIVDLSINIRDFPVRYVSLPEGNRYQTCIRIHMAVSQNCVWNVPWCSGRMERRGFVAGIVPDHWSVRGYT